MSEQPITQTTEFESVRDAEVDLIRRRREVAAAKFGAAYETTDNTTLKDNLVGLALSGGGIRSSAFCLGVIKALKQRKLLPLVDYLSTVSGGGYAGAYLSSLAFRENLLKDAPLPLEELTTKGRRKRHEQFIGAGRYLRKTRKFLNWYLIGTICNLLFVISTLVCFSTFVAASFRSLNGVAARTALSQLGFRSDIAVAMFPAAALFFTWLLLWVAIGVASRIVKFLSKANRFSHLLRKWSQGAGDVSAKTETATKVAWLRNVGQQIGRDVRYVAGGLTELLFFLMLVTTGAGIAVLLGTGDIDISSFFEGAGTNKNSLANKWTTVLSTVLYSLIGATLLPYLRPKMLLRSGEAPKNAVDKYLFWAATRSLMLGIPFVFIASFAREDISHWHSERPLFLHRDDVRKYDLDSPLFAPFKDEQNVLVNVWHCKGGCSENCNGHCMGIVECDRLRADMPQQLDERINIPDRELKRMIESIEGYQQTQRSRRLDDQLRGGMPLVYSGLAHLKNCLTWCRLPLHLANWKVRQGNASHALEERYQASLEQSEKKDYVVRELNRRLMSPLFFARFTELIEQPDSDDLKEFYKAIQTSSSSLKSNGTYQSWFDEVLRTYEAASELPHMTVTGVDEATVENIAYLNAKNALQRNRELLRAVYGDLILPNKLVYSRNVLTHDQQVRWSWCLIGFLGTVFFGLIVDLNATSWHSFYSERIADTFIVGDRTFRQRVPLKDWKTTNSGLPHHIMSGALHKLNSQRRPLQIENFEFSSLFCGSSTTKYLPSDEFMDGEYCVRDALGVSGAAITPLRTENPLIMAALFLANVRLGQWLMNPLIYSKTGRLKRLALGAMPFGACRALFNAMLPFHRRGICFIADGGHYENLGIEPLLRRKCRLIIAVDATEDGNYEYRDFNKLLRVIRLRHGITFETTEADGGELRCRDQIKLSEMDNPVGGAKLKRTDNHYFVARIRYPDDPPEERAYLVYLKSSMTGDESQELVSYQFDHPAFPHNSTSDQFYSCDRFESYLQLGYHIAQTACDEFSHRDDMAGQLFGPKELIEALTNRRRRRRHAADELEHHISRFVGGSTSEREAALLAIDEIKPTLEHANRIVPPLLDLIDKAKNKPLLGMRAALVLSHYGRQTPQLLVSQGLSHRSAHVRRSVLDILAHVIGDLDACVSDPLIESVFKRIHDDHESVRLAAMETLESYVTHRSDDGSSEVNRITREMIDVIESEPSHRVRDAAVQVIAAASASLRRETLGESRLSVISPKQQPDVEDIDGFNELAEKEFGELTDSQVNDLPSNSTT